MGYQNPCVAELWRQTLLIVAKEKSAKVVPCTLSNLVEEEDQKQQLLCDAYSLPQVFILSLPGPSYSFSVGVPLLT